MTWVTTEEYDNTIIREVLGYQKLLDAFDIELQGARVLDLGGHKGYFSRYALARGAKEVVAVEPSTANCKVFKKNARGATLIHGACIGWEDGPISLTRSPKMKYSAAYSVARKASSRMFVESVPAICFGNIANEFKSKLVKIDFQGSEWGVFDTEIPRCVKAFFGELHYSGRFEIHPGQIMTDPPLKNKRATEEILMNLRDQGFDLNFRRNREWQKSPPYGTKMWFQDVVFLR